MIGADLAVLFCWVMDGFSNRVEASTDLEFGIGIWMVQSSVVSICCVFEQDILSALLQSTQLTNVCQMGKTHVNGIFSGL